jgi:branched-chain amino acid transport system substrate-binding protein
MAIDEINQNGGVAGYKLEAMTLDSGTQTAGQYDPAQAVMNYRKFIADKLVIAAVGPVMSGEGKAISPVISEANMATVTPSSTNPDITDPRFKGQYRPKGKPVYFRNVTTDAYQGPNMANYLYHRVGVRNVYVLDDGGAFGNGVADTFQGRARALGIRVLGRDRLDPRASNYRRVLTRIKGMNPDALYYGGVMQAAAKLAPQAYELIPRVVKAGSDGIYDLSFPTQAGRDEAQGWYVSIAGPPDIFSDPGAREWIGKFRSMFKRDPTPYSVTSYQAVLVIVDAVTRVAEGGKPVNRSTVREAIERTNLQTPHGRIAYDENGDLKTKVISIYQINEGVFRYLGIAPEE